MNTIALYWWIWQLKSGSSKVQAITKLGEAGDHRAIKPLVNAMNARIDVLSERAATALGQIKDTRTVEPLIDALERGSLNIRREVEQALGQLGNLSSDVLSSKFLSCVGSVPLWKLVFGPDEGPKKYARLLKAAGWKPKVHRERMLFAFAQGDVLTAAREGGVALEPLTALLSDDSTSIRERTAQMLSSGQIELPRAIKAKVESILHAQRERLEEEAKEQEERERDRVNKVRERIEALSDTELICLRCQNTQKEGQWEEQMEGQARVGGAMGFVNINAKPQCLKCGSTDLAGPGWAGYLLKDAQVAYYAKLRSYGVKAGWIPRV
jgi:hypothetical protein